MRRGEQAGLKTFGAADGVEHGADGAFTVGPGDVEDGGVRGKRDGVEHPAHGFQPELDAGELRRVKPGERVGVIHPVTKASAGKKKGSR